jgi:hypothetical protein
MVSKKGTKMKNKLKLTIEDNVPLPPRKCGRAGSDKYMIRSLQPGQSVFVPGGRRAIITGSISGLTTRLKKKGVVVKFATRAVSDDNISGIRIWRLK